MSFIKVEPGEKVVIAQHGLWGERAAEIATRIGWLWDYANLLAHFYVLKFAGANVNKIIKPPGQGFTLEEIEEVRIWDFF